MGVIILYRGATETHIFFNHLKSNKMKNNNLNTVKVLFTDSKYNYETNVSANSTEQTAKEYFVNKYFDLGVYPKEDIRIR